MILWDDQGEVLPEGVEPPSFVIEAKSKGELIDKILYNLELSWAIMKHDGVDGIDYHEVAKQERNKHRKKRK